MMTAGCSDPKQCLRGDTVFPNRQETLAAVNNGQAGRDLMAAVFDRDREAVSRILKHDPRLVNTVGARQFEGRTIRDVDLLYVGMSTCDKPLVQQLLAAGVPPNGPPHAESPPMMMAVMSTDSWFTQALLEAGASPNPLTPDGESPINELAASNSLGGVKLLLDHGFNVNAENSIGRRPLQRMLDGSRYQIAELLLDHGADPWAADHSGGTLGWAVSQPPLSDNQGDLDAYARLQARVRKLGWPVPAPSPAEVRERVKAGEWPPPRARSR